MSLDWHLMCDPLLWLLCYKNYVTGLTPDVWPLIGVTMLYELCRWIDTYPMCDPLLWLLCYMNYVTGLTIDVWPIIVVTMLYGLCRWIDYYLMCGPTMWYFLWHRTGQLPNVWSQLMWPVLWFANICLLEYDPGMDTYPMWRLWISPLYCDPEADNSIFVSPVMDVSRCVLYHIC